MDGWIEPLVYFAGGMVLLVFAGERLVRHSAHLAVSYRMPKTVVGAVILGFGTSLPELFVSVTAALEGSPGIAIGNVVGSNIANVGLILGTGAFLVTVRVERNIIRTDLPIGILAALFLILYVGPRGEVEHLTGLILLAAFLVYLWLSMRRTKRFRAEQEPDDEIVERTPGRDLLFILLGLAGIGLGAHFLVDGAAEVARLLGVSERVIGVTMVALGTSLPELAALVAAARKGEADLAVGNVAGSNLFNLLFVLGVTAVIHPVPVSQLMVDRDFVVLAVFAVLAFPLLAKGRRIRRIQGFIMLGSYFAYILWTYGSGA
ncbi:MAG: calcium/sodium antiporter [Planctomycetota bacterium]|jgi:cation:H+ antiporter